MPKAPITHRETFFSAVRGQTGLLRHLEWNVVQTELGVMVEPRTLHFGGNMPVTQTDQTDYGVSQVRVIDESEFFRTYNTGGSQLTDFNA